MNTSVASRQKKEGKEGSVQRCSHVCEQICAIASLKCFLIFDFGFCLEDLCMGCN